MNKILFKSIAGNWVLNIPFGKDRVLVLARGRMMKTGKFNNWLPCNYFVYPSKYKQIPPTHKRKDIRS